MRTPDNWFIKHESTHATQFSTDPDIDEFLEGWYVCHRFTLKRDPKRVLLQFMTPDEAEKLASDLIRAARDARVRS